MKKILLTIAVLLSFPFLASAQATVVQGGTGLTSVSANSFLVGLNTLHLTSTSSPFFSTFTFGTATGTSATTTNLFSTTASSTNLFGNLINGFGLVSCNAATSALTYSAGLFGCHTISVGTGTVTSVTASTPNSTLTLGGTNPITTSGTISFDLNLSNQNVWTAASTTFTGGLTISTSTTTNATTTSLIATTASTTNIWVGSLGKAAGTFVAADASGKLIATTTPSGGGSTTDPVPSDGSDGAVVFDGTNTFSFASKSGNFYTLTRDIYPTTFTINSGKFASTSGYRIIAQTSITNSGTLDDSGTDGRKGATGDAGGTPGGAAGVGASSGTMPGGTKGCVGGVSVTNTIGANGQNGSTTSYTLTSSAASGGAGGPSNVPQSGGNGGNGATITNSQTIPHDPIGAFYLNFAVSTTTLYNSANVIFQLAPGGMAGCGGGAGGASGAPGGAGGGSGGGGGVMYLAAPTITNSGTISAKGGNGGAGGGTSGNGGGGGGGGGGTGGDIFMIYHTLSNTGTLSTVGGTLGAAGVSDGSGTNGNNGGTGITGNTVQINY